VPLGEVLATDDADATAEAQVSVTLGRLAGEERFAISCGYLNLTEIICEKRPANIPASEDGQWNTRVNEARYYRRDRTL